MAIDLGTVITIDSASDLRIYENEKSFRIFAGPGAGKTYLLIENIKLLVENSPKLKKSGRKILCITYTNAATDEIKKRLGTYIQYVYVSTIHSFLYDVILRNNQVQLRYQIKDKYDIDLPGKVMLKPRVEGMNLLATCKKEKLHEYLIDRGMPRERVEKLSKTQIGKLIWDIKQLNQYPFNDAVDVPLINNSHLSDNEVKIVKSSILEVAQELDFDEILYWGYVLIKEYKHIKYSLRYRFPYVFVDEYQDTNPIQNATLKLFADDKNVVFGVIGDLIQSIYGFQGATHQEFENFQTTIPQLDYKIDDNRRSTDNIIKFCSYFRQGDPIIPKQDCAKNTDTNLRVKIILHTGTEEPNTLFDMDDNTAILCRSSAEVFSFTNIETKQKIALKKIADTYQYAYGVDMTNAIEQGREDWLKLCKFIVDIKEAYEKKSLALIISACEGILDVNKITKKSNEQGKYYKKLIAFIERISEISSTTTIRDIESSINDWLVETEMMLRDSFVIPKTGDEQFNINIHANVRLLTYDTMYKMIKEVYSVDSKIMTIHKAKGLEFKKVIVGIEPFGKEKHIEKLKILKLPGVLMQDKDSNPKKDEIAEYTRVIYVGLSRAIDELSLYVKVEPNEKEIFKRDFENSLRTYMESRGISTPFYEFVDR